MARMGLPIAHTEVFPFDWWHPIASTIFPDNKDHEILTLKAIIKQRDEENDRLRHELRARAPPQDTTRERQWEQTAAHYQRELVDLRTRYDALYAREAARPRAPNLSAEDVASLERRNQVLGNATRKLLTEVQSLRAALPESKWRAINEAALNETPTFPVQLPRFNSLR